MLKMLQASKEVSPDMGKATGGRTIMNDLEKLINELLELPSFDLEGDDGSIDVRYTIDHRRRPFVLLGDAEGIYLDPTQALILSAWLDDQVGTLVALRESTRLQQIEDASTREQREAERLNALKALHSDAVVAWQQGGCAGSCPSFDDIVRKEQFVRVDLGGALESIPVTFVKQFPMLERMREGQRG
jgi:hypothetical protein